jgi:hypothetical protein
MFLTRVALITCAFYVCLTALWETVQVVALRGGSKVVLFSGRYPALGAAAHYIIMFALIWVISFVASWFVILRHYERLLNGAR